MPAREIAHPQWKEFLLAYARQHVGWLAGFVAPKTQGTEPLPLHDIRLECVDGHDRIVLVLGEEEHVVPHPRHLRALRADDGAHQGLEIVSSDGDVTALRFREATRPETLDGMAPGELAPGDRKGAA